MICKIVLIFTTACIIAEIVLAATDKIVCYHGIWSSYRRGYGKFRVEDIDPTLCTHLVYSFVGLDENGTVQHLFTDLDINQGNIIRFNALKYKNKNLKTLVSISTWDGESTPFSLVAADPRKRANFIRTALNFVETRNFDGFDLDWEFPAQKGGSPVDKENFAVLIKEFSEEFSKHGLLLTAAVAATTGSVDVSYDVPVLSKYLDIINVMSYDLHGSSDGITGQNSPLYASSADVLNNQTFLTVDAAIRGWIERGADPQKLILGFGVYGKTYTLVNPNSNNVGASVVGAGNEGPYTAEPGVMGFNEIVELKNEDGWNNVWDDEQKTPYIYKENQWIGYDNPKSAAVKAEYAKSLNLGGVMIWSVDTDDFRGVSGTKYPILSTINKVLGVNEIEDSDPDPEPEQHPPPRPGVATEDVCRKEGYVRDPFDCGIYYYCLFHNGVFIPLEQKCNSGLYFDAENLRCDYPYNVPC